MWMAIGIVCGMMGNPQAITEDHCAVEATISETEGQCHQELINMQIEIQTLMFNDKAKENPQFPDAYPLSFECVEIKG